MVARTGLFTAPLPGNPPTGTSPTDGRLVLGALFGTGGGCVSGGQFFTSTSVMQIGVGHGVWRIPDPTNASAVFLSPVDDTAFILAAGPASGSRIDTIWVKQDNYENGDADSRVVISFTAGTPAASPSAPTAPAGAMVIATVLVPTGASSTSACTVTAVYPAQATLPPAVAADTLAHLPAAGQYTGQIGIVGTTSYRWNGSTWRPWSSPWTTFVPGGGSATSVQNFGAGTSSSTWYWRYTEGEVEVRGDVTLAGSGCGCFGDVSIGLPVSATGVGIGTYDLIGEARLLRGGVNWYAGDVGFVNVNAAFIRALATASSGANALSGQAQLSASFPWSWAAGDGIAVRFKYTPA